MEVWSTFIDRLPGVAQPSGSNLKVSPLGGSLERRFYKIDRRSRVQILATGHQLSIFSQKMKLSTIAEDPIPTIERVGHTYYHGSFR